MNKNLVLGVGVYIKGKYKSTESGRTTKAYGAWQGMLRRCYDPKWLADHPTYIGCKVCDEWLEFQVFAEWYDANFPKGGDEYDLDKDLKVIGNNVYSPDNCLFVSRDVNKFTISRTALRGDCLIGVHWDRSCDRYIAQCCNPLTKKQEKVGYFTDELEAHLAWRKRKSELAYELAMTQSNPEVRDALLRWKDALDNNEIHTV